MCQLERIYNKFIEIHEHNIQLPSRDLIETHTKVHSIIGVGTEKFMIKFDICADDALLDKAKVFATSDVEAIVVGSNKDIQPNSCRTYETQIYSAHSENIEIEIIEKILAQDDSN